MSCIIDVCQAFHMYIQGFIYPLSLDSHEAWMDDHTPHATQLDPSQNNYAM